MIVVAENDDGTRTVLASALARSGYDVASVTDGQLVLSTLESGKVGLLILDLRMPGMNGWEVLRRLEGPARARAPRPTTRPPVIVISAQSDPETQRFATRLGAAAFLAKPIDLNDLGHTVRRVSARGASSGKRAARSGPRRANSDANTEPVAAPRPGDQHALDALADLLLQSVHQELVAMGVGTVLPPRDRSARRRRCATWSAAGPIRASPSQGNVGVTGKYGRSSPRAIHCQRASTGWISSPPIDRDRHERRAGAERQRDEAAAREALQAIAIAVVLAEPLRALRETRSPPARA